MNMLLGYIQISDQCKQHMLLIIILLQNKAEALYNEWNRGYSYYH